MADATFTAVDLSRLAAPDIVEALDFETIYAAALAQLQDLLPGFDATVESDPVVKLLQLFAYRELLLRQRINDAARAIMPAYAVGADLDNIAALFGITRFTLSPADEALGIPAVMESDADFRRRMVLAPEGYSVAGPEGAYIFHALSADADVLDASATSPAAGEVLVSVLSRTGDGAASVDLVATVDAYVSDETRRPLTDFVTVQSAEIVEYAVDATLTTFSGPDGGVVLAASQASLDAYVEASHRIGRDITRSAIFAALHVEGVQNVELTTPAADIVISRTQAPYCTGTTVNYAGTGE
ncbi:baseplate assembly protein [Novosphingobium pentaromativorans]|uniref:Putative phage baseplate assembly protein n=1 Tax=Novosphingobium pentaromativorans US6-1 TaxID=1088721 RepID=G6EFI0_9SPHN|nr:baseplate J/gp47 family protein [Novosphingobium pentaromativorans]AIT79106.1 baseplate assembly protein [Novosphingobium pentaromativorans US6-1]EHJ59928.1 putative phage baseplate assembly protein [Novosphingobium pentaromativorans US6-1]